MILDFVCILRRNVGRHDEFSPEEPEIIRIITAIYMHIALCGFKAP